MIALLILTVLLAFVSGVLAAPSVDRAIARYERWRRPPPRPVSTPWPSRPFPQEGPPTNRCRATDTRRGRCLHDQLHLGDHLYPVDLGLPISS